MTNKEVLDLFHEKFEILDMGETQDTNDKIVLIIAREPDDSHVASLLKIEKYEKESKIK